MAILFYSDWATDAWVTGLRRHLPGVEVYIWPEVSEPGRIIYAVLGNPPSGILRNYPSLRAVCVLSAGVDSIAADPDLPREVSVVRIVDAVVARRMTEYVLAVVLRFQRRLDEYARQQDRKHWQALQQRDASEIGIGLLGLGHVGAKVASTLSGLGYDVAAWTRRPRAEPGLRSFHGTDGLGPLLERSDILICLLPLTAQTRRLLDSRTLRRLPRGAYLINCARGAELVEEDLLAAVDDGHLSGAMLDVFQTEPLPANHPFWNHPRITVTPHVAGLTNLETALPQVVENFRRLREGRQLLHEIDRGTGY